MFLQITLGDIIGWIITIVSVGVAITVNVKININKTGDITKINQSKSQVKGDQIGGNKN